MLPHEKALVKRLQDEPFALLGINNDRPAARTPGRLQEEEITWRNALEPEQDSLASRWNVEGYPMLYLLDARGVIRHKWLGSPDVKELDRRIDELVAEALKKE